MSSEATVIFFGIRFSIEENEISSVQDRSHPLVKQGRAVGLQFYWEDFGVDRPRYYGFIGKQIGILGVENQSELVMEASAFETLARNVRAKLITAGISDEPHLHMQWMPPK